MMPCVVEVYDEGYTGEVTTLVGAPEPFITQEIDDADIFTPARTQSGYIRVVDNTGTLMASMMPENNVQRYVALKVANEIKWQGFMVSQAFEQPWDDNYNIIEFPVASILASLANIQPDDRLVSSSIRFSKIFLDALRKLFGTSDCSQFVSNVITIDNLIFDHTWLYTAIPMQCFFSKKNEDDYDVSYPFESMDYLSIMSEVCKAYGLTMRESGTEIIFANYDSVTNPGSIGEYVTPFSTLVSIAETGSPDIDSVQVEDLRMSRQLRWRGTNNSTGFVQGLRNARVELSLNDYTSLFMDLPRTIEDMSDVIQVPKVKIGTVYVQPHAPRTYSNEEFSFYEMNFKDTVGRSTYQDCLDNCVLNRPLFDPQYSVNDHTHTGAFPCRWYYKKEAKEVAVLKNGLFLNQMYLKDGQSWTPNYCYKLKSPFSFRLEDGYINIDMQMFNFTTGTNKDCIYFGTLNDIWGMTQETTLYCMLKVGNKYWNGSAWVDASSSNPPFGIHFVGNSIVCNKTADMSVGTDKGWLIPVTKEDALDGEISFYILNMSHAYNTVGYQNAHSRIISDLSINYLPVKSLMESARGTNNYYRKITQSFSEDKDVALIVGSFNNNWKSSSFIIHPADDNSYVVHMLRFTDSGSQYKRPEEFLLDRIERQYKHTRRYFKAQICDRLLEDADLCKNRFTYNGRTFVGFDSSHNWRDSMQIVNFVEIL